MDFDDALRGLNGRQPESQPEPTLDRIRAVADLLDNPQLTYPTVHVTGTNGKTTTTRMITALACAQGLSTGTFISPHVEVITERLSVCGAEITEEEFAEEYERLVPFFERVEGFGPRVTYFEALTAMAYLWFADKPVGLGAFEVGMGGLWDATNLIAGDVAVLCPVGLDHPELGSTVEEVATEKAGIIKAGKIAVAREQRPEALSVIQERCKELDATLLLEGDAFALESRVPAVGGQSVGVRAVHRSYEDVYLPIFGEHMARNAAAAIVACESLLGRALDEGSVRDALRDVRTPARLEVVRRRPLVVLDGAHNPDAGSALVRTLAEEFTWRRLHLVIGMFRDKDVEAFVRLVAPLADRAYACVNSSPRTAPAERVVAALNAAGAQDVESHSGVREAVEAALEEAGQEDLILVTGSFYTVADARPLFVVGSK
ncbi:MAG TPA: Mur ligase family protein [Actinomycetota bacterium]|nr:Mur ligase family protein [Actinomycetota bacterium]